MSLPSNTSDRCERTRIAVALSRMNQHAVIARARRRTLIELVARLMLVSVGGSAVCGRALAAEAGSGPTSAPVADKSEFASAKKAGSATSAPAFTDAVLPILNRTCVSCHGPEKVKAGLRLDSLEGITKGGDNGAVIKPGKSKSSPLIQRLLLPLKHDDHMPPAEKPQPTAEEIALLRRWVDAGAPGDASATKQITPAVQTRSALTLNQEKEN